MAAHLKFERNIMELQEQNQQARILGRTLAEELSNEELDQVSGGCGAAYTYAIDQCDDED